jgi:hypothetical protein
MTLKTSELISIVLSALTGGMVWGRQLALSRSISTFKPEDFLAVVRKMSPTMESGVAVRRVLVHQAAWRRALEAEDGRLVVRWAERRVRSGAAHWRNDKLSRGWGG